MIRREDILYIEYLKKSEYTGSHKGMRYRLEQVTAEEGSEAEREASEKGCSVADGKALEATVWPEPYSFAKTPAEQKTRAFFSFDEDGIVDAVAWMNDILFQWKDS